MLQRRRGSFSQHGWQGDRPFVVPQRRGSLRFTFQPGVLQQRQGLSTGLASSVSLSALCVGGRHRETDGAACGVTASNIEAAPARVVLDLGLGNWAGASGWCGSPLWRVWRVREGSRTFLPACWTRGVVGLACCTLAAPLWPVCCTLAAPLWLVGCLSAALFRMQLHLRWPPGCRHHPASIPHVHTVWLSRDLSHATRHFAGTTGTCLTMDGFDQKQATVDPWHSHNTHSSWSLSYNEGM